MAMCIFIQIKHVVWVDRLRRHCSSFGNQNIDFGDGKEGRRVLTIVYYRKGATFSYFKSHFS